MTVMETVLLMLTVQVNVVVELLMMNAANVVVVVPSCRTAGLMVMLMGVMKLLTR